MNIYIPAEKVVVAEAKNLLGTTVAGVSHELLELFLFVDLEELLFLGIAVLNELVVLWMTVESLYSGDGYLVIASVFKTTHSTV